MLEDAQEQLARAWAAFKITEETETAAKLEQIGKEHFGNDKFGKAMKAAEETASKAAEDTAKMIFE